MIRSGPHIDSDADALCDAPVALDPCRVRGTATAWRVPGFGPTTRVMTSFGILPVHALRRHDPVRTVEGTYLRVQWIDEIRLDADYLAACPDAAPVVIRAGALGLDRPAADVVLSPHQQISLRIDAVQSDLLAARELTGRPNVYRTSLSDVTYVTFHCGVPAMVLVDGIGVTVGP